MLWKNARQQKKSSPRTWRCFYGPERRGKKRNVFSTHVEVFLKFQASPHLLPGLLHARGGVSSFLTELGYTIPSSPRTWRCFYHQPKAHKLFLVFSTHVEVFPPHAPISSKMRSLLHARGGVSTCCFFFTGFRLSSPRTWRCFCHTAL